MLKTNNRSIICPMGSPSSNSCRHHRVNGCYADVGGDAVNASAHPETNEVTTGWVLVDENHNVILNAVSGLSSDSLVEIDDIIHQDCDGVQSS